MHPPPPVHGPPPEGRDWRGRKTMEETMRVLTLTELMRLTRIELCNLLTQVTSALACLPEGSPDRDNSLTNLRNIRAVLAIEQPYTEALLKLSYRVADRRRGKLQSLGGGPKTQVLGH
jgi:hypothetical protein